jgi:hypothetical protein
MEEIEVRPIRALKLSQEISIEITVIMHFACTVDFWELKAAACYRINFDQEDYGKVWGPADLT